ncbi:sarcosine oxidase subunit gamma [Arthrobacter sp. ISL-30]|uniref:sarcosine oxidase subunit gamma n=1 Tax=Arthrobacter sp. ISL-30 TaxID=2819109 RepID=UPI001BE773A0|nr:sarcosine oxidase subunit gamma family protein [Arthrobacter sp. ISL-30]MBT2513003.1 sarcosine oxidase subunit gamma family protein [Arthrobacter sp. ISL-30]
MAELTLVETTATQDISALRSSPAAHLAGVFEEACTQGARGVQLREVPFQTMVGLRVAQDSDGAHRLEEALGTLLPDRHGIVTAGSGRSVIWLAPDEFLVISAEESADLTKALQEALYGHPGSVIDLSANRTTFELNGPSSRAVLEKGCPLDLHPRIFKEGTAVNTNIGHVPVVLWKTGAENYRIYPRASFADYLGRWLIDAMAEFKAPETN